MTKSRNIFLSLLLLAATALSANVTQESLHFVTTEAGIGYSALLNTSDLGKSSGITGGKLQVGYEWNYRKLLVHTGLEFAMLSNKVTANPFSLEIPYTIGLPDGMPMKEHFDFQSWTENQLMGQLNIPVQVGGVFANRYYFLAGARVGLPLIHTGKTATTVKTSLTDPYLIGVLNGVPVHDATTSDEVTSLNWQANIINAQLSAEFGLVLNSFFDQPEQKSKGKGRSGQRAADRKKQSGKPVLYRVGVFADYGLTSCAKTGSPIALAEVAEPRQITLNPYFAAADKPVNSLLVGAKFAVLFQMNMPKPPAKPQPSYFDVFIADAQTDKAIPASLTIYEHEKKKTFVKEARNGHVKYRAKDGQYTFTASNEQYYPATRTATMEGDGVTENIRLALQPKPVPVVIDTPVIDIPIKVGTKVVMHNLFFATNKTQILPESEEALNELAAFMSNHPALSIRITGHTDNVGSERDNQILSEGRANAVRDELIRRGIAGTRIEAEGKGESEPIADNATEEGRARNRRVEFTITATGDEDIEQIRE